MRCNSRLPEFKFFFCRFAFSLGNLFFCIFRFLVHTLANNPLCSGVVSLDASCKITNEVKATILSPNHNDCQEYLPLDGLLAERIW